MAHSQSGRASPWSRSGSARPQSRAFQERISASRRNGNGPISPSRGRRRRCSGRFSLLRFGRPIPKSPSSSPEIGRMRSFLQRRHGRRSKALFWSAPNLSMSRHDPDVEIPAALGDRLTEKRSATYKIRKVELMPKPLPRSPCSIMLKRYDRRPGKKTDRVLKEGRRAWRCRAGSRSGSDDHGAPSEGHPSRSDALER